MRTRRIPIRTFLYAIASSLVFLLFLPPRSFCAEKALALSSLTVDQRNHLPDNTSVALPWRRTVTLGQLRAEHRARMERFAKAAAWGKAAAGKLTKPLAPAGTSSLNSAPAPQPEHTGGRVNSQAVTAVQNSSAPAHSNTSTPPNLVKGSSTMVANANSVSASLFLVPRQGPPPGTPVARDYLDFCNAAQASACIYIPPNATFIDPNYVPSLIYYFPPIAGNSDQFLIDPDPLLTDQGLCKNLDGVWSTDPAVPQICVFFYFSAQQTNFKPAGNPASAASCNPQMDYHIDRQHGTILAEWPGGEGRILDALQTEGPAMSCVVQEWLYPSNAANTTRTNALPGLKKK